MIYLDNSATTRQYDEVTKLMLKCMKEDFGNPSSLYEPGLKAEKIVKKARDRVASALGVSEGEVYFTSGGTESDNTAVYGAARSRHKTGHKIIISDVEHPAIGNACARLENEGFELVRAGVGSDGRVDALNIEDMLDEDTIFVSVMHVNNETGAIQPVEEIAAAVCRYNKANRSKNTGIIMHTDAIQSLGKIVSVKRLVDAGVDMISVSGHKIHGPKGIGALYISNSITIEPLIVGGGQERNMRSGTENVPGIAGFGLACEIADTRLSERSAIISMARNRLLDGIKSEIEDVRINSHEDACASVLNVSFAGTRGEVLLHTLETDEIYVSTGSACSSGKNIDSRVLSAMGLSHKEIEGTLRFSFSEFNTAEEMDIVLEKLKAAVSRFRKFGILR